MLDRRGRLVERRTMGEILEAAVEMAARLARVKVVDRTPVVVALPTSWSWLEVWFGALAIGAQPVAISPASALGSANEDLRRLAVLLRRLQGRHLVCSPQMRRRLVESSDLPADLVALTPEELAALPAARMVIANEPEPSSSAFLQLTSGTTGESRIVMIPHRAVLHNLVAIRHAIADPLRNGLRDPSKALTVSWLPLFTTTWASSARSCPAWSARSSTCDLLPPAAVPGPARHLATALDADPAYTTFSAAPNFGYQFCVEQLADSRSVRDRSLQLESGPRRRRDGACGHTPRRCRSTVRARRLRPDASTDPATGWPRRLWRVTMDRALEGPRTRRCRFRLVTLGTPQARRVCLGPPVADTELRVASPDGARAGRRAGSVRSAFVARGFSPATSETPRPLGKPWMASGSRPAISASSRTRRTLHYRPHQGHSRDSRPEPDAARARAPAEGELGGGGTAAPPHSPSTAAPTASRSSGRRGPDARPGSACGRSPTRFAATSVSSLGMPIADLAFVRGATATNHQW